MTITDEPIVQVEEIESGTPRRTWTHKKIAIGAAAVVAVASLAAVFERSRGETEQPAVPNPAVPLTMDEKLEDLVDRGLIPRQALEPAPITGDRQTASAPIVIGTGPTAVYVGPAPTFGGDPARGETDDSYHARTGRHLPGRSNAAVVDGPWWYGPAPITGGDPAPGETDDSYYARTGRHLPAG